MCDTLNLYICRMTVILEINIEQAITRQKYGAMIINIVGLVIYGMIYNILEDYILTISKIGAR